VAKAEVYSTTESATRWGRGESWRGSDQGSIQTRNRLAGAALAPFSVTWSQEFLNHARKIDTDAGAGCWRSEED
jgi:hypothetical protein